MLLAFVQKIGCKANIMNKKGLVKGNLSPDTTSGFSLSLSPYLRNFLKAMAHENLYTQQKRNTTRRTYQLSERSQSKD